MAYQYDVTTRVWVLDEDQVTEALGEWMKKAFNTDDALAGRALGSLAFRWVYRNGGIEVHLDLKKENELP
jgi:hypothetical protein